MAINTSQIGFVACSSTNVTSSGYVTIPFGTEAANPGTFPSTPISVSKLQITDTTGKILKIAYGDSGSEVDMYTNAPSGTIVISKYFPPNVRLSVRAIDSSNNASSGYIAVSLVP